MLVFCLCSVVYVVSFDLCLVAVTICCYFLYVVFYLFVACVSLLVCVVFCLRFFCFLFLICFCPFLFIYILVVARWRLSYFISFYDLQRAKEKTLKINNNKLNKKDFWIKIKWKIHITNKKKLTNKDLFIKIKKKKEELLYITK